MCFWTAGTLVVVVDAAGFEARLGLMVLIIVRSAVRVWRHHFSSPSLFIADCLPRRDGICPVICQCHMPRPWSFKVSCRIWHFQSVMNWHSHKCVWHAAFSLIHLYSLLRPIISDCLSTAESKLRVVCEGHLIYRVFFGSCELFYVITLTAQTWLT